MQIFTTMKTSKLMIKFSLSRSAAQQQQQQQKLQEEIFFSSRASKFVLEPTQLPIQWAPYVLCPTVKRPGMKVTTYLLLVPRLRINEATPHSKSWHTSQKLALNDQWLEKWTLGRPKSQQDNINMYVGHGTVCEWEVDSTASVKSVMVAEADTIKDFNKLQNFSIFHYLSTSQIRHFLTFSFLKPMLIKDSISKHI